MRIVLLLLPLTAGLAVASEPRPPNIVLLFVDDMGYADMGTQGAAEYQFKTPRLDQLAAGIGEVLDCLKQNLLEQDTLVIFASDNGPYASYGDHAGHAKPLRGGKLTCFEGGVRVPCLMRWPGRIPAGRVSDALLSSIDLLPTIAGIAGARLPERPIDGVDVWPVISGQSEQSPRQTFNYYSGQQLHAVRYQTWKLHFPHEYLVVAAEPGKNGKPSNWENMKPLSITESGIRGIASRHGYRVESMGMELYDLSTDISESRNVAAAHPDIVRRLQRPAESVRIDLGDSLNGIVGQNVRPRIEL